MDGGPAGEICTNQGRCESECRTDLDCPTGAFCAESCGVCFNANLEVVTCFVRGLTLAEVLGACRGSDLDDGRRRAAATDASAPASDCAQGRPGDALPFPFDVTDAAAGVNDADVNDADVNDADVNDADAAQDVAKDGSTRPSDVGRDGESDDVDP
ncbi:MAG: hypothetical protein U0324_46885 [Polyangiales bacterium]